MERRESFHRFIYLFCMLLFSIGFPWTLLRPNVWRTQDLSIEIQCKHKEPTNYKSHAPHREFLIETHSPESGGHCSRFRETIVHWQKGDRVRDESESEHENAPSTRTNIKWEEKSNNQNMFYILFQWRKHLFHFRLVNSVAFAACFFFPLKLCSCTAVHTHREREEKRRRENPLSG